MASPPPSTQKPNIVVIMSDDVGSWNIGAYHRGMMAGRTPPSRARAQPPNTSPDPSPDEHRSSAVLDEYEATRQIQADEPLDSTTV